MNDELQFLKAHFFLVRLIIYFGTGKYDCVINTKEMHYVKSVRIRSFSGPYFPAFGLNFPVFSPNAGKYGPGKLRIRTLFTQLCLIHYL